MPRPRSPAALVASVALFGALALGGCISWDEVDPGAAANLAVPVVPAAAGVDFSVTRAVFFGDELVGYVVEILPVPAGLDDDRGYPPGTWLLQDLDFRLIGFISPNRTAWRFDEHDEAQLSGMGNRDQSVANIFARQGSPKYARTEVGVPHTPPH